MENITPSKTYWVWIKGDKAKDYEITEDGYKIIQKRLMNNENFVMIQGDIIPSSSIEKVSDKDRYAWSRSS